MCPLACFMWVMLFLIPSQMPSYPEEPKPTQDLSDSGDVACTLPALLIYLRAAGGGPSPPTPDESFAHKPKPVGLGGTRGDWGPNSRLGVLPERAS